MRLPPVETVVLRCDAPPDGVAMRIASAIRPCTWVLRVPEGTLFGEMSGWGFKALLDPPGAYDPRGTRYFHPVLIGRIEAAGEGSSVHVRLRPTWGNLTAAALVVTGIALWPIAVAAGVRLPGAVGPAAGSGWIRPELALLGVVAGAWYIAFLVRKFRAGVREATARLERILGCRTGSLQFNG